MWKIINSPIIVTLVGVIILGSLIKTPRLRIAPEIRGAYNEINDILSDAASDAEKTKAIQDFAQEIGLQIRSGFSEGFKTPDDGKPGKKSEDQLFIEIKDKIVVFDIESVTSNYSGREEFIYKIKNGSDQYIKQLRVNFEYYKGKKLIDCKNDWISDIKLLVPGQEMALRAYRNVPKENGDNNPSTADEIKGVVTSFSIAKVN